MEPYKTDPLRDGVWLTVVKVNKITRTLVRLSKYLKMVGYKSNDWGSLFRSLKIRYSWSNSD